MPEIYCNDNNDKISVNAIPVLPSFLMMVESGVFWSQPSSSRFWKSSLTCVKSSLMSMGDCRAVLHEGYLLGQFCWFRVPEENREANGKTEYVLSGGRVGMDYGLVHSTLGVTDLVQCFLDGTM